MKRSDREGPDGSKEEMGPAGGEFRPRGRHPRHILNEIRWRGLDLGRCEVDILHRGAPGDTVTARASEMTLGRSFFGLAGSQIPYHRILCIRFEGRTVFRRSDIVRGK